MDEKYYKRFESFSNSLNTLAEAKTRDLSDSFVKRIYRLNAEKERLWKALCGRATLRLSTRELTLFCPKSRVEFPPSFVRKRRRGRYTRRAR